ncbi:WD40-repeat-containing domain protein [Dipodascopsis uninucleata]
MEEELLVYGVTPVKASGTKAEGQLTVCKLRSTANIISYKQIYSLNKGIAMLNSGFLVAQNDRPIIHSYSSSKEAPMQRIVLPEKISVLTLSHSKAFLLAGTHTGKLILWELSSGICLAYKDAHYDAVKSIVFSSDDSLFFSGGSDAKIYTWRLMDFISSQSSESNVEALASCNHHSLGITQLYCGYGSAKDCKLYSVSLDGTCRVWHAISLRLISTFIGIEALHSLVVDPVERAIYVGCESGRIIQINLFAIDNGSLIYIGGLQKTIEIKADSVTSFTQHNSKVLALDLSYDASVLVSGSEDTTVMVWDVSTRQVLRNIKQTKGPVSFVKIIQKAPKGDYVNIPSLKFTVDPTSLARQDCWIAIEDQDEENATYSINGSILSKKISSFEATMTQVKPIKISNEESNLKLKYEKLNSAYNELWNAYNSLTNNDTKDDK